MKNHWSWSHSLKNYLLMFDLTTEEFDRPILDVAAGPSSFNSEMHYQGYQVTSCDPLYAKPANEIETITTAMIDELGEKVSQQSSQFNWGNEFSNLAELLRQQRDMAAIFCRDFPEGLAQKRYCAESLPRLSFEDFQFSLALCANFIFDGSLSDDIQFQLDSIHEMCRVAQEVRIYPLLDQHGRISPQLGLIMSELQLADYGVEIRQVSYQFFKHGNAMLRVFSRRCELT
ncbi:MAG: SAM-dependent methyltransferase [Legionellales bacterium]|nr:SAM-dependent methyltransferase [Legionellales bacterium]